MEEPKTNTTEPVKYEMLEVYEGAKFKTLLTRKHRERKAWTPDNPALVTSFIPGTIRKVFVKDGQRVKAGDKLLTLEAMKMLNELSAAVSGTVKTIHIKTGQVVSKNQLLVELIAEPEKKDSKKDSKKKKK
jgi:biotin carboxyl carrier protein